MDSQDIFIKKRSETLENYNKALADVIAELTKKRTELNELAHQSVENLQTSIPALRTQVVKLEARVVELDKAIEERELIYSLKKDDLDTHYRMLENLLKDEYRTRKDNLDMIEEKQLASVEKVKQDKVNIEARENELNIKNDELVRKEEAFTNKVSYFEHENKTELKNIERAKEQLENSKVSLKADKELLRINNEELAIKFKELSFKNKQADEIIERISEAQGILNSARYFEQQTVVRQNELNEQNVKVIADTKKNNLRSAALDDREEKLNKREDNLKMLEASAIRAI